VIHIDLGGLDFSDSWQYGDETARWRSAPGHSPSLGAEDSGSSILQVEPGHRLPRHTDSAEEIVAVLNGTALVTVGGETARVRAGSLAVVPKCVPHEVGNGGDETLTFAAVYAEPDVVTTYEREVWPNGSAERQTVS